MTTDITRSINPAEHTLNEWIGEAVDDRPIVMVNLLRFREQATYPPQATDEGGTGKAAYKRYSKAVTPLLWGVGGQILWMGKARSALIAPESESWDECLLVHYPNRKAFIDMITSPAYQDIVHHRDAALLDSRLIETRPVKLPKPLLALFRLSTRLTRKVQRVTRARS